jgi:hypothetical protein
MRKERRADQQRTADDDACCTFTESERDGGDNREDAECAAVTVMVPHGVTSVRIAVQPKIKSASGVPSIKIPIMSALVMAQTEVRAVNLGYQLPTIPIRP